VLDGQHYLNIVLFKCWFVNATWGKIREESKSLSNKFLNYQVMYEILPKFVSRISCIQELICFKHSFEMMRKLRKHFSTPLFSTTVYSEQYNFGHFLSMEWDPAFPALYVPVAPVIFSEIFHRGNFEKKLG